MGRIHLACTPSLILTSMLAALACMGLAWARQNASKQERQANSAMAAERPDVARGRYLVEQVAKCGECHTPRDEDGNLDRSRWLDGATIWIKPVHQMNNWAEWAPRLAGLPAFTDKEAEAVLEKGIGPNGAPIRPPMHIYHMSHADAVAIVAYLRSLPKGPSGQNPR